MGCNTSQEQAAALQQLNESSENNRNNANAENQQNNANEKNEKNSKNNIERKQKEKAEADHMIIDEDDVEAAILTPRLCRYVLLAAAASLCFHCSTTPPNNVEAAATKIQAVFRGHQVRVNIKHSDSNTEGHLSKTTDNIGAIQPTKEELEAEFNPDDKDLNEAVTKIQACFRGSLARKGGGIKEEHKNEVEVENEKVVEELDIDMNDPELHMAASKIQATFRGHKVRKSVDDAGKSDNK